MKPGERTHKNEKLQMTSASAPQEEGQNSPQKPRGRPRKTRLEERKWTSETSAAQEVKKVVRKFPWPLILPKPVTRTESPSESSLNSSEQKSEKSAYLIDPSNVKSISDSVVVIDGEQVRPQKDTSDLNFEVIIPPKQTSSQNIRNEIVKELSGSAPVSSDGVSVIVPGSLNLRDSLFPSVSGPPPLKYPSTKTVEEYFVREVLLPSRKVTLVDIGTQTNAFYVHKVADGESKTVSSGK